MVSYGSGAGSDAFILAVTERIDEVQRPGPADARPCSTTNKVYLDYGAYAKFRGKIRKAE